MSTPLTLQIVLLMILAAILVANVINSTIKTKAAAQLTIIREMHGTHAHTAEAPDGK